jgi:methyl-accepting chemotaxis protein
MFAWLLERRTLMKTRFRSFSLRGRFLLLPVFSLLGLAALQGTNSYVIRAINREVISPNVESLMMSGHKNTLKSLVDSEAQTLSARLKTFQTRDEKIAAVVAEIDPIRFLQDGSGYFFSYDAAGIRIDVPINKNDNGKNLMNLVDKNGYRFVQAFVEKAQSGGGFVTYYFEKPGSGVQPKLSYVTPIPGTDFLIGTGVYVDNVEAERTSLAQKIEERQRQYWGYIVVIFLLVLGTTVALTLLLSHGFATTIENVRNIVNRILRSSEQVAAASAELSSQSQALGQGASRQAATIEETTASLKEMSGIARSNRESAREADEMAKLAQVAADRGLGDMQAMSDAISAINASSHDISKIIKTIDEIAFQTNILALNAAVEAARAGQAGMGFAVVADAVRTLSLRSAQAAKETTEKIEEAIAKTANGVSLSGKVAESFNDIAKRVRQVVSVADQVAHGSMRQTESIAQIDSAVGVMNQVTQSAAASAEESAASAEQLSAQAHAVNDEVSRLLKLVGG